jgi:hypothetical protein
VPSQDRKSSEFPLFPADFTQDTVHLHQALAEHNYKRVDAGLSLQNYFQLSEEDRKEVIERSNMLKFSDRSGHRTRVIPIKQRCSVPPKSESWHFPVLRFCVIAGIGILIIFLVAK